MTIANQPGKDWRACSFSLYHDDKALLEKHVAALRARDGNVWNASKLIRLMIRNLSVASVPSEKKK